MDSERVRVNVFAPGDPESRAAAEAAFEAAASVGKGVDARGTVPLADILMIGSVATHALAYLINTLRKAWSKGVVIDAMGGHLTIRQDPALPRGHVIVRSASGEVTVRDGAGLADAITGAFPKRAGSGGTEEQGNA
ncbi:hypothetical protein ELQ87_25840 [Streptomyces griseoviridis]|uniref:Uncharacterized protein n=1 Tax=Streptomyces griseoviridis TaxID=45398 RepID=A0A3Q9KYC8_STRGD|nr:hypothetical protein [Streptomyces griseoviridis]AZS87267.1 hypothetical protein ELQ87_25840 [Streptomyces griseoviridis]QCN85882.1 hypothetical protein DDJ31_13425 [Streptomyces griseoviridis]